MKSKLLKILTGVVAASAVGAPVTAFASPVKATEAENTNTETTDTASDVKTTDKALEDTKKEAKQDTTKSETTSGETKNDTTNKDSNTSDEKTTKDSTSDNQADNTNTDAKNETAGDQGKTNASSQLSETEKGYVKTLDDYIQGTTEIDLNNLSQYNLFDLYDRTEGYSPDLSKISEDFIKNHGYTDRLNQANKVTKAVEAYFDNMFNSPECVAFRNKMKTIDTSTPEGAEAALKAYSQLSPRLQEYMWMYTDPDQNLLIQEVIESDAQIKPVLDILDSDADPDWNAFFKQYNQLSPEKKAIVNNLDPDKIKSGAKSLIEKSIDDANKSKQSDALKNFLADFAEAAANPTSQSMDQLAKEYLSLSKADQAYVQSHLKGAYDYFGLDDAVAKAQKSDQKENGKDNTAQKGSTVAKKLTAVLGNAKTATVTSAAPKTGDTTDALPEILALIAGIGGAAGVGIFKTRKEKRALRR
ncbi:MAG: hypothetical protein DUD26_04030 [Eubacteriaceae bacterium]|uniref:LPXTG cell wall anchor domain-containing protein n=1 Tax=Candidatus Pseudoramibacter fermentans TaxID=2594427 RepID=A0A6L5GT20_9FIRM|nr:hypothetical protein [Candidatus Pseudoramibacter fermentans]RRF93066.1 MAG: hypothetical protein DUD26_04030 [Eubacteriaceae bacterium]